MGLLSVNSALKYIQDVHIRQNINTESKSGEISKVWMQYGETSTRQRRMEESSLCSASCVSRRRDAVRFCCRAPAVQQSIGISWLPGPQQQTRRGGRTDG